MVGDAYHESKYMEPPEPERIPLLCRLGLWHRWSKWGKPEMQKVYWLSVEIYESGTDACVQSKQCRGCGLVKTRVVR